MIFFLTLFGSHKILKNILRSTREFIFLCISFVAVSTNAQDLVDLLASARERDPAFAIAKAQLQATIERNHEAGAGLLPTLNATGTSYETRYTQSSTDYETFISPGSKHQFSAQQWAFQLTQPLFRLANYYTYSSSKKQVAQAEAQLVAAENDLANRVVTAWFDLITAQEILRSLHGQREATLQQLAASKRSFEVGTVSIADVRESEAKHAVVVAQEAGAEYDLYTKQELLSQLTGQAVANVDASKWMKPNFADLVGSLSDWVQKAREFNPNIIQVRYQLDAANIDIAKARTAYSPTIDLVANHNFNTASGSTSSDQHLFNDTVQLGVQVNVPLFAGFGNRAKVREAIAMRDKAHGERDQAEDQVLSGIKQAYFALRGALLQIPALETAQNANQVAVKANKRGYEVGMRTNVDVLNAMAQLYQTEKDLTKVRADAWQNYIKLKVLSGQWTVSDLSTPQ